MVVLDTNIVIDQLRLPPDKETIFTKLVSANITETFAISVLSVQELYQGKSSIKAEKEQEILTILERLKILPYNFNIAKLAGEIIRDCPKPIEFTDAAIAATAIINEAKLVTLNKKDFQIIKNLQLV